MMHRTTRVILAVIALALSATYYTPLWKISLSAPQYPEGLGFEIWINKLSGHNEGDLAKINNLNHYIGMKKIVPESIPELKVMPWVMRGVLLLGLCAALVGRRSLLLMWLLVFAAVATLGFIDYYNWGYDYGHNLDTEHAIIKVPGMSYQPPLIGTKKLLNFEAISLPGAGGWVAIGSFMTGLVMWILERRRDHRLKSIPKPAPSSALVAAAIIGLAGCSNDAAVPINYGLDQCDYCRMTIANPGFGSELVTRKGKAFKFDSIECLAAFEVTRFDVAGNSYIMWVSDFKHPGTFLPLGSATICHSKAGRSPMGVGLLAFASQQAASEFRSSMGGDLLSWADVRDLVSHAWSLSRGQ